LERLSGCELPPIPPYMDVYISNLITATSQHPLLSAPLGRRVWVAFEHFVRVSTVLFSADDGNQHTTQEDVARVYVHVVGHRIAVRPVGECVTGILDRTTVPLPGDEGKQWRPGIKRDETVAHMMREILGVV